MTNPNKFITSIVGVGKGCIRFFGQLLQKYGFMAAISTHRVIMEETGVATCSRLVFIRYFLLAAYEDMHEISRSDHRLLTLIV